MGGIQKLKLKFSVLLLAAFFALLNSCAKKEGETPLATDEVLTVESKSTNFKWFYLIKDGFVQIEKPQRAPAVLKKPWTETLRISYMAQANEKSPLDIDPKAAPKVYALVNHVGIIALDGRENKIHKDDIIFLNRTADKVVFMNGTPIVSLYKNSIFNDKATVHEQFRPFLVQFTTDSGVFFPILTYENLSLDENSHVNDFCWNGEQWFCSVKTSKKDETNFSYLKFRPETALLSISPESNFVYIEESFEDEFRQQRRPQKFEYAPERVQELLGKLPSDFNFYAECKLAGGPTPREYLRGNVSSGTMRKATVQIADTWIGALFQDGTMYLNGALYGQRMLNGGKPIALRLPKLPRGYVYSDFGISGTTMFASWEECDFYQAGRAGFIEVDLAKILYGGA